ncbi:hypothetical protein ACFQO7_34460 [Catellatospora aurea]|uniref:Transposase n=1 Tax=Catellatospora aurea TaxID=1337874 RepID=A0ABW2HAH5_9ACTN
MVRRGAALRQRRLLTTLELRGFRRKTDKIDGLQRFGLTIAVRTGRVTRDSHGYHRHVS